MAVLGWIETKKMGSSNSKVEDVDTSKENNEKKDQEKPGGM